MRLLTLLRVHEVHERLEGGQDVVSQVPAVEPADHILQHPHPRLHGQEDYDDAGYVLGPSPLVSFTRYIAASGHTPLPSL